MQPRTSKRLLQGTVAVLSLVPALTGLAGILTGPAFLTDAPPRPGGFGLPDLDSHVRYLSGIFLGVGLMFFVTVPAIERKTRLFRLAASLVVCGGLARLVSLLTVGAPSTLHLVGLFLELAVVPLLVVWQAHVASQARAGGPPNASARRVPPGGLFAARPAGQGMPGPVGIVTREDSPMTRPITNVQKLVTASQLARGNSHSPSRCGTASSRPRSAPSAT